MSRPPTRRVRSFMRRMRRGRRVRSRRPDIFTAARHIAGPTGNLFSNGWEHVARGGDDLNRSLEEQPLPPSLHISQRDRTRYNVAIPLKERCIEDWNES